MSETSISVGNPPAKWIIFDVESMGLTGPSFAAGWVVLEEHGLLLEEGWCSESMGLARPKNVELADWQWLNENIPNEVRNPDDAVYSCGVTFGYVLKRHPTATLVADCPFPVEAAFLLKHKLPAYPLLDVATALTVRGLDPVGYYSRMPDELPMHHPLNDARQSARLWMRCMNSAVWEEPRDD